MTDLDRPKLRPGLQFMAEADDRVAIADQFRLGGPLAVSHAAFDLIRLFDGTRTLLNLQAEAMAMFDGEHVPLDTLQNLVTGLDEALFLESSRLDARLNLADRPPVCVGSYDADPGKTRRQLKKLFTAHGGPGLPGEPGCRIGEGRLRAVLVPHMDYKRGGVTYGWGFKELSERTDATLFVVVATSHYSARRFTLTRQNFTSPFGRVETDQGYIDRLVSHYGEGLFDDPFAHVAEHSIELEVVLMQYLFEKARPFRIVPLLVGSFSDRVRASERPEDADDIGRMVAALKRAEAECGESICYVISGDLAHIGPKFNDDLLEDDTLLHSAQQDELILGNLKAADADAYFRTIAAESDTRRICGLPPTYLTLAAAAPARGRVLHYGRFVHPERYESVSFASAVFEG